MSGPQAAYQKLYRDVVEPTAGDLDFVIHPKGDEQPAIDIHVYRNPTACYLVTVGMSIEQTPGKATGLQRAELVWKTVAATSDRPTLERLALLLHRAAMSPFRDNFAIAPGHTISDTASGALLTGLGMYGVILVPAERNIPFAAALSQAIEPGELLETVELTKEELERAERTRDTHVLIALAREIRAARPAYDIGADRAIYSS